MPSQLPQFDVSLTVFVALACATLLRLFISAALALMAHCRGFLCVHHLTPVMLTFAFFSRATFSQSDSNKRIESREPGADGQQPGCCRRRGRCQARGVVQLTGSTQRSRQHLRQRLQNAGNISDIFWKLDSTCKCGSTEALFVNSFVKLVPRLLPVCRLVITHRQRATCTCRKSRWLCL